MTRAASCRRRRSSAGCADDPLEFTPGTSYEYSNTDNIVVGLMAEKVTGRSYARLLRKIVFEPLGLRRHELPDRACAAAAVHPRLRRWTERARRRT